MCFFRYSDASRCEQCGHKTKFQTCEHFHCPEPHQHDAYDVLETKYGERAVGGARRSESCNHCAFCAGLCHFEYSLITINENARVRRELATIKGDKARKAQKEIELNNARERQRQLTLSTAFDQLRLVGRSAQDPNNELNELD